MNLPQQTYSPPLASTQAQSSLGAEYTEISVLLCVKKLYLKLLPQGEEWVATFTMLPVLRMISLLFINFIRLADKN